MYPLMPQYIHLKMFSTKINISSNSIFHELKQSSILKTTFTWSRFSTKPGYLQAMLLWPAPSSPAHGSTSPTATPGMLTLSRGLTMTDLRRTEELLSPHLTANLLLSLPTTPSLYPLHERSRTQFSDPCLSPATLA